MPKIHKQEQSRFLVTINTNKTFLDIDINYFKAVIAQFYDYIEYHIKYKDPHRANESFIDHISMKSVVGIGEEFHRVHCHLFITITHRTKIHLDQEKIRTFFQNQLGLDKIHLNIKYANASDFYVERYLMNQ
jgi:hypothetical protein